MQQDRHTLDAVWRAQVRSVASPGRQAIEINWDIKKCYENVRHSDLQKKAKEAGYPLSLLRVSLNSYTWPRRLLGEHNTTAPPISPKKGIVAGSSAATFEIALLLQHALGEIAEKHGVVISIHVDDLAVEVTADSAQAVVDKTIAVAAEIQAVLRDLGLPLASDKSLVLCSSEQAKTLFSRTVGDQLGKVVDMARRLGADHRINFGTESSQGCDETTRRRAAKTGEVARKRAKTMKKRIGLLRKLGKTKAGRKAQARVALTGITPGFLYGAECNTPQKRDLTVLRRAVVDKSGLRVPGVATSLSLLGLSQTADPQARALIMPLTRWHREIWYIRHPSPFHEDKLDWGVISKAMSSELELNPNLEWERPGPVAAAVRAARFFGLEFLDAGHLRDAREGVDINLTHASPAKFQRFLWKRVPGLQLEEALLHRLSAASEELRPEALDLIDQGIDHSVIKRALTGRGKRGLSHREKRRCLRMLSGNFDKGRSEVLCQHCQEPDTLEHRLFHCKRPRVHETRSSLAKPRFKGDSFPAWSDGIAEQGGLRGKRAWFRKQADIRRTPEESLNVMIPKPEPGEEWSFLPHLPVYTDGSALYPAIPGLESAGAAALQHVDGKVVRMIGVVLPSGADHTAAMAEHVAGTVALKLMPCGHEETNLMVADCNSVLRSAEEGPTFALQHKRPFADLWEGVQHNRAKTAKVKAHRTREQAESLGEEIHFEGNRLVDLAAKDMASMAAPAKEDAASFKTEFENRVRYLQTAATLLAAADEDSDLATRRARRPRRGPREAKTPHDMARIWPNRWACKACGIRTNKATSHHLPSCKGGGCVGARVLDKAIFRCHNLVSFKLLGSSLFACTKCGNYSYLRTARLGQPCGGAISRGATQNRTLSRLAAGWHPTMDIQIGEGYPINEALLQLREGGRRLQHHRDESMRQQAAAYVPPAQVEPVGAGPASQQPYTPPPPRDPGLGFDDPEGPCDGLLFLEEPVDAGLPDFFPEEEFGYDDLWAEPPRFFEDVQPPEDHP